MTDTTPWRPYGYTMKEIVINAEHSAKRSRRRRERTRRRKLRNLILGSTLAITVLSLVLVIQGGPS